MPKLNIAEAKESALRLLARREYSAFELKQRLLAKGCQPAIAEEVIELLGKLELQSDKRFVESYVRRRMAKGYGPLHITHHLVELHVESELIQSEIDKYREQWPEIINEISLKKYGTASYLKDLKQRTAQIRFFQSRGFSLLQIKQALASIALI